jgi:hypothetical protein
VSGEHAKTTSLKQKAEHEVKEITIVFVYLAFFFCAMATYSMLLLNTYDISFYNYGAALLNAFLVTKVILLGEAAHVGKREEDRPLLYSAIYKAFLYSLLVFAFHIIEETVIGLFHGKPITSAFHDIRLDELLARTVIVFCTFIPFFAFRELGRVMGQDTLRSLLVRTRPTPVAAPSTSS